MFHVTRASAAAALCLMLAACGDETTAVDYVDVDPDPAPSAPARTDCEEVDFGGAPLQGPGFEGGVYIGPTDGPLVASSTLLYLLDRPGTADRFEALMTDITAELAASQGLLGFAFGGSTRCGAHRTLTVWRDAEAMMGFVASEAHVAAMMAVPEIADRGSRTAHWGFDPATEAVDWPTGVARAAAAEGVPGLGGAY